MKKMSKLLVLLLVAAIFAIGLAGCNGDAPPAATQDTQPATQPQETAPDNGEPATTPDVEPDRVFQIGIIQLFEHPALDAAREGFISMMAEYGVQVDFDYQNAQGDHPTLSTIADRFVSNDVDLVLAIATPSVRAMFTATDTIPIVGSAITSYERAEVIYSNEAPGTNVTGASDMNPIQAQIDMIFDFVPHLQTLGIVYSSNEANSVYQAELAIAYAESLGLTVEVGTVTAPAEVQQNALAIASRVDAIWIPTDNAHATSMAVVGQVSIDTGVPVFPGEDNMVMGGGVATLSINYYELGRQSGRMAIEILLYGGNPATMPIVFGMNLNLSYLVNGFMAEELGLDIPARFADYVWFPE
ncbi:MAG: ABC transporter substrate-binding protein [Oscillospiraceae bacterium]|nr:ABC transporter substrate-binding protein [Oscillospiraceae bacterium]